MFDTSVLSCFARADRLEVLDKLTASSVRRVTTRAIIDEIERGIPANPALISVGEQRWLEKVPVDSPEELGYFAEFARRLVDRKGRNVGEASALAWIKVHGGVLFSDDQYAIVIAKEQGITPQRTLRLLVKSVCDGLLRQEEAATLIDELIAGGAWFPCNGSAEFLSWANREGFFDRT
ncbi:MAG TPA: hypothetical protein VM425_05605 [Myxococcota bacterium]|nr:hypothetical protein [Myxococcota bacterium]